MNVFVTEDAFCAISEAVVDGKRRGMELGGSIVAFETKDTVLVAYAIPTGPRADQGPGHLRTDAGFQNHALAAVHAHAPELAYVGDWHVHPMWLPSLSGTDRRTAERILREERPDRSHLLLLLGTAAPHADPIVIAFIARLTPEMTLRIDEFPIQRVARDSEIVVGHFGRKLLPLDEILSSSQTMPEPVHHRHAQRILDDLDEIRKNLHAEANSWASDNLLGAIVRRGKREAFVLFPPEYPLGAPQIFAGSLERGPLRPIPLRFGWSSLHCLTDLVEIALRPPVARASPARPSTMGTMGTIGTIGNFLANALSFAGFTKRQTQPRALGTHKDA